MLIALLFFNFFDAISTYYFVIIKGVEELNPVMNFLLEVSPILFLIFKLIWCPIAVYVFWKSLPYSVVSKIATIGCFVPYCLLTIYYIIGWTFYAVYGII